MSPVGKNVIPTSKPRRWRHIFISACYMELCRPYRTLAVYNLLINRVHTLSWVMSPLQGFNLRTFHRLCISDNPLPFRGEPERGFLASHWHVIVRHRELEDGDGSIYTICVRDRQPADFWSKCKGTAGFCGSQKRDVKTAVIVSQPSFLYL